MVRICCEAVHAVFQKFGAAETGTHQRLRCQRGGLGTLTAESESVSCKGKKEQQHTRI